MPESVKTLGEFTALLASITPSLAGPVVSGENWTVKEALWLGARVRDAVRPLTANALPVTVTCARLRFALPVFVRLTFCVLVLPTGTSPKLRLVGFRVAWGDGGALPTV